MIKLGERLKELREEKNLSQTELAKHFNIARSTYSQYESNTRAPSDDIKIKFAEYFNVSIDYLLGLTNIKRITESDKMAIKLFKELEEVGYTIKEKDMPKLKLACKVALTESDIYSTTNK
jgi:transcriptional regulator with XRE-family HTH domain